MSFDLFSVPYHIFMRVKKHKGSEYLLEIEERPETLNHLGTTHASVQFFLAEASSGEFLLQEFDKLKGLIPVVRKAEAKYHRPANGNLYSKTHFETLSKAEVLSELNTKNRVLVKIKSEVFDSNKNKVLSATFEWFLSKDKAEDNQ
jgi:hypothetical protein